MRLPDFLIIGAMKAGTTSLFFDLAMNPSIFFPGDKEPHDLASDEVLSPEGQAAYGALFRNARPDQVCGEASTGYSKQPDIPGVPERAVRVIGTDLKVVYLVREPVSRTISHHHHDLASGDVGPDVDRAVREHPRLVDYSMYARQISPWSRVLGPDRVRIVRFETYVEDRATTVAELSEFLGVDPTPERVKVDRIYNRGDRMWAPSGPLWRFSRGPVYRDWIRSWLPRGVRSRLRDVLLPKAPARPAPPSLATVDYILDRVGEDVARLQELAGWETPPWDLVAVRRRFTRSE